MLRRTAAIAATAMLFVMLAAVPAFGWGNGPYEGNGYGTHDWALEHAIRMAGEGASWVDVDTALLASDDPDYGATATDGTLHSFKEYGWCRGGPQAIADQYYKLMTAYNAGDYQEASRLLGILSHYYLDICQPYHTTIAGTISNNPRHFPYELKVSDMTNNYGDMPNWLNNLGRKDVTDVRQRAVVAARYARSKYANLDASYKGYGMSSSHYAYTATGYVLNQAVNDLTDIIQAVPQGKGLAQAPTTMRQKMYKMAYHYPGAAPGTDDSIRTQVVCLDAAGKPMEGVAVTFTWPLGNGPKSYVAYTDATGLAYMWEAPGVGIPLMRTRTLTAKTVQSSMVATSSTWYMPTPVLASRTSGLRTTLSSTSPRRNTVVKATTRVRDTAGKPVVGLPVTYSWCFKSRNRSRSPRSRTPTATPTAR